MAQKNFLNTKQLLWCGVLAGPIYVLVSLIEIMTREGFDITRHSWSVLSNGDLGWIHITNFLVTGLLTILGAIGIKRVLAGKKGGKWAPKLLMIYGFFLILAGIFKADAVDGFPPGTPLGPPATVSTSGILHLVFGTLGFIALIAACIVFYKHFKSVQNNKFARSSLLTGIYFLVGFISLIIGAGFGDAGLTVSIFAFTLAVILSWSWYSLLSWHVLKTQSQ